MDLETVALFAEIRFKILEAAVMINNQYTEEEVINHLIETANYINNFTTVTKE